MNVTVLNRLVLSLAATLAPAGALANLAYYPGFDVETVLCGTTSTGQLDPALLSYCGLEPVEVSASPVTLQLSSSSAWAPRSSTVTIRWSSTGATQCVASGDWSGSRGMSGAVNTAPLVSNKTYSLMCSNSQHSSLASVAVRVRQAILSWEPPARNTDGTVIDNLTGYRVYWGPSSRNYQNSLNVPDPQQTSMVLELPPGTHYFAITALSSDGLESRYSNEGSKEIR